MTYVRSLEEELYKREQKESGDDLEKDSEQMIPFGSSLTLNSVVMSELYT